MAALPLWERAQTMYNRKNSRFLMAMPLWLVFLKKRDREFIGNRWREGKKLWGSIQMKKRKRGRSYRKMKMSQKWLSKSKSKSRGCPNYTTKTRSPKLKRRKRGRECTGFRIKLTRSRRSRIWETISRSIREGWLKNFSKIKTDRSSSWGCEVN